MKKIVPVVLICSVLSSCNTWNEEDKDVWRSACMETATKWAKDTLQARQYCNCVLEKMVARYPDENDALEHMAELSNDSSLARCKKEVLENR